MDWLASMRQAVHAAPNLTSRAEACAKGLVGRISSRIPNLLRLLQLPLVPPLVAFWSQSAPDASWDSCPNAQLSCHNTSLVTNTCCFNAPGGQLLQTQFWDTNPAVGPIDSWTIHGLWPDHCNGNYDAYCDKTREYSNISSILSSSGGDELLSFMKIYWKDYQGDDHNLWRHEWSKHGTCISTLDTKCYHDYKPQAEVVDYFNRTVSLFTNLQTYQTLAAAGVVPSSRKRWTLAELQAPLNAMHGAAVTLRCRNGEFDEVWYHYDVRGSVQAGQFVAAEPDGAKTNCPASGIKYVPKRPSRAPTSTATTSGKPRPTHSRTATEHPPPSHPTGSPFTGKGFLDVITINPNGDDDGHGERHGCLISAGWWYLSGTCASFRAHEEEEDLSLLLDDQSPPTIDQISDQDPHFFTLTSSKGPCGFIDGGTFECARTLRAPPTIFSFSAQDGSGKLAYRNRSTFYAASLPGKFDKRRVYASRKGGEHDLEVEVRWAPTAGVRSGSDDGYAYDEL